VSEREILNEVTAGVIVFAITSVATWLYARVAERARHQQKIDAAPNAYVKELDELIQRGFREGEGMAIINARAIVAVRNSLRSSLISISTQLNSEIDRLSSNIGEAITRLETVTNRPTEEINPAEVYRTIQVLVRTWPAKRTQIKVEIRKILAELGLDVSSTLPPDSGESGGTRRNSNPTGPSNSPGSESPPAQDESPPSGGANLMPNWGLGFNSPPEDPPKYLQAGGRDT
jgi:hypothetical protein